MPARVLACMLAAAALAGCGSSSTSTSAPPAQSTTASTTASTSVSTAATAATSTTTARAASKPAPSRAQLIAQSAKSQCGYLRYGSGFSRAKAIATIRAQTVPQWRDVAALGCAAAYR